MSNAARAANDAGGQSSHIFHPPDEALVVLRRPKAALISFADYLESKTDMFFDPQSKAFHLWRFMPPPSYDYACGLRLPADARYRAPFPLLAEGMLVLRLGADARAEIRLGAVTLSSNRKDDDHVVKLGEDRVRVPGEYLHLTVRRFDGAIWIGANGVPVGSIPEKASLDPTVIRVKRGACHLVAVQSLEGDGRFLAFDRPEGDVDEFRDGRNPFRFDWGLRTCGMLNIFIALAIARDIATAAQDDDVDPDVRPTLRRIRAAAERLGSLRYVFESFRKWPQWRPSAGLYPENGTWDRNSFSNGTIPALFALLARLYGCADDSSVIDRFHDRGTAFLGSIARGSVLEFRARDEDHWVRRSANHGLIMLTAYMLGAKLLGQAERDDVKKIDRILGGALHRLHEDGSFCEGVAYQFFGQGFFLPYVKLFGLDHAYDEQLSIASLTKLLGATFDWISLSHTGDGEVFANFGDNFTQRVRRTSHLAFLQRYADGRLDAPEGYEKKFDEFFSLAPDLDVSRRSRSGLETRAYPNNQTYLAAAFEEGGGRSMGLFVIGSTLQRTHNHNHDCGGFAFYWGEAGVLIPEAKREAHLNNAVGVMRGGRIEPHRDARNYSGEVRESHASETEARAISRVEFDTSFGEGSPLAWLERDFRLRPWTGVPLVIRTRLQASPDVTPFLAFHAIGFRVGSSGEKWLRGFARRRDGGWEAIAPEIRNGQTLFLAPPWAAGYREHEFLTCFGRGDVTDAALIASCMRPTP